jgi:voltage-gated potassium channel
MKNIPDKKWKNTLYKTIFEADTKSGKIFDIVLLIMIALSVIVVLLNSVESINRKYSTLLIFFEWFFTFLFTIEFFLRVICVKKINKYVFSFFGIIDILAVFPNYIVFFISGISSLIVFRVFRLLRIFIVFKLGRYIGQANYLLNALKKGFQKIVVFLGSVLTIVIIMGALMYLIEGPENGFINIPKSMYWAIVTLTTVGYGDISPQTVPGQTIAAIIMLLGYGIIAIPTGILSAEITIQYDNKKECPECKKSTKNNSNYCSNCGFKFSNK